MPADWTPKDLKENLDAGSAVFLKIWQRGCGPCKLSKPAVERLEESDAHGLIFAQICLDDHEEIGAITKAEVLPAFFIFRGGKMVGKFEGFKGLDKLTSFVSESLTK